MYMYLINLWRACAVRVTVVGTVYVSINQHLTSGVSVHPENVITYSMGHEGQKLCVDFSETAPLQRYTASWIVWLSVQLTNCVCTLLAFQ